jgi:hypothetical protein
MNLHGIVRNKIGAINPIVPCTVQHSTGSETGPSGKRTPGYGPPVAMMAQVQALTTRDLMHLESLNIQGATHKIYLSDPINGVVRSTRKGGDLIALHDVVHGLQTYLVTGIMEEWPEWTALTATLQSP